MRPIYTTEILKRLATDNLNALSLKNGMMGKCILFFVLADQTENPDYKIQAEQSLDQLLSHLLSLDPITLIDDLAEIGWSIEFLIQNNYIEGDSDEILTDFDLLLRKALQKDRVSLDRLVRIGHYFRIRHQSKGLSHYTRSTKFIRHALRLVVENLFKVINTSNETVLKDYLTKDYKKESVNHLLSELQKMYIFYFQVNLLKKKLGSFLTISPSNENLLKNTIYQSDNQILLATSNQEIIPLMDL